MRRTRMRVPALLLVLMLMLTSVVGPSVAIAAQDAATPSTEASPGASPVEGESGVVDLDVLFIGAHPDDEASRLSTYGQWNEFNGMQVGVITITRGEGGGNAVGTEEGPALGLIREQEERAAVGLAGIEHIYNLDKVDFYYNLSAELTEGAWGYDETLERVVRVIRATTPEVIVTMNPSPNTHGHHQMAARFAVAAFDAAGDPSVFPEQIEDEGLQPWSPSRIFTSSFVPGAPVGESCAEAIASQDGAELVFGVWGGVASELNDGQTWAQVERTAQRMYASQGWAGFPDVPEDPEEIGCDIFALIDSRAPFTVGNADPTAMLEGALFDTTGGLPAGTMFDVEASQFDVVAGQPFEVTSTAELPDGQASDVSVSYELPEGWTAESGEATMEASDEGASYTETVTVVPAEDADVGRVRITATLSVDGATGQNVDIVQVTPPVEGHLEPLPQVAHYREWLEQVNQPALDTLIKPVVPIGVGETRDITVTVTNNTADEQDASVTIVLAEGFTTDNDTQGLTLAANETTTLTFGVTNEDTSLPTGAAGGLGGDYLLDIRTVASGVASTEEAGINLVPVVNVPAIGAAQDSATPVAATPVASPVAAAPTVDGVVTEGEYASGPLDVSRVWEGDEPDSPEDASGVAWISWDENGIYVAVEVTDEAKGTVLPELDAKRHWRTDSVEIGIDPLGMAENTSATFKVGVFAETEEGGPAAYRDADAYQGPVAETAPGFEVASTVSEPYTGYVVETFIPFDALPAPVDPDNMTMNIFIYDSDTEDLTGQTRLGWSIWGGVQGTPYRWGQVHLEGLADDGETGLEAPQMPLDVAESVKSPWSIIQAAEDGVGLGGHPKVADGSAVSLASEPVVADGAVTATLQAGDIGGTIRAYAVSDGTVLDSQEVTIEAGATADLALAFGDADPATVTIAVSFQTEDGAGQALAVPLQP